MELVIFVLIHFKPFLSRVVYIWKTTVFDKNLNFMINITVVMINIINITVVTTNENPLIQKVHFSDVSNNM